MQHPREFVEAEEIAVALGEIFDCALISHGLTDYVRDYDLVIDGVTDPAGFRWARSSDMPQGGRRSRPQFCVT